MMITHGEKGMEKLTSRCTAAISSFRALFTLLLITGAPLGAVFAQQSQKDFAPLEKAALEELRKTNTPGAAVAVVSGDRIVYVKGLGLSNVETGTPVAPEMLFRSGSVGKMFTAALLTSLAEEGKIKLDEPIGKYVRGLSSRLSQVTTHQLLSGTAGLIDGEPLYGPQDESALAKTVRSWNNDIFFLEPGKLYSYSNLGFIIAGLVAEEIGGKSYADLMSERIFAPLGMKSTTFRPTMAMTRPLSQGHDSDSNSQPVVHRPFEESTPSWPAGFMYSNVYDLARFAIAFMNGGKIDGRQILSPAVITMMSTPHADILGENSSGWPRNAKYGYGLILQSYRGVRMVWHGGSIGGFGAMFVMVPEQRFAVIILANKTSRWMVETAEKAMEIMLPLEAEAEALKQSLPMSAAEKANYVGKYVRPGTERPETAEIFLRDDKLYLRAYGFEQQITKVNVNSFSVTVPNLRGPWIFKLLPDATGKAEYLCLSLGVMKRVKD
jgi:CubicO group peptidase (beta-lactamase class C family)